VKFNFCIYFCWLSVCHGQVTWHSHSIPIWLAVIIWHSGESNRECVSFHIEVNRGERNENLLLCLVGEHLIFMEWNQNETLISDQHKTWLLCIVAHHTTFRQHICNLGAVFNAIVLFIVRSFCVLFVHLE